MYTVFGASTLAQALMGVFAVIVATALWFTDIPSSFFDFVRWALVSASVFMVLAWLLAGWSGHGAPWRQIYRRLPKLNTWVFPDLNGVWYGTTHSNWSVIKALREAASTGTQKELAGLAREPLQKNAVAMEIKANLFRITIKSKLGGTGGYSKTLFCRAERNREDGDFSISYLYRQETPEPASTDEGSHDGAATLQIEVGAPMALRGIYWNRRSWREGSNTAGRIEVQRVSDKHAPAGVDLLAYARDLAERG